MRPATEADAPALCAAARAVVRAHDGLLVSEPHELIEADFASRIRACAAGAGRYLVVEEGGAIVAHASLFPMEMARLAHIARLDLCVHLGHWRRGHGTALLAALVEWARDSEAIRKIELNVRSANQAAIALYTAAGFVVEGRLADRVRLTDGRFVDDLLMALHVSER